MTKPTKCKCKDNPLSCKKDCKRNHTHKTIFCEICEPDAFEEPKKDTLAQIKFAAEKLGYSARISFTKGSHTMISNKVIQITPSGFIMQDGSRIAKDDIEKCKILGWLYVGQLFGKPEIPIGQKFKDKMTGEVMTYSKTDRFKTKVCLVDSDGTFEQWFDKSELQPYFPEE
jgi:hypothetical protein